MLFPLFAGFRYSRNFVLLTSIALFACFVRVILFTSIAILALFAVYRGTSRYIVVYRGISRYIVVFVMFDI